jgi:cell pole-organizing protein PopZ
MSAANSSYDLDALHRAQRAYEPSMEEILASIRNIISEDRPGPTTAPAASAPQPAAAPEPSPAAPPSEPQPAMAERSDPPVIPRVVWPRPEAETFQKTVSAQPFAAPTFDQEPSAESETPAHGEPLVSPEAQAAIASSFEALSVGVAVQNSTMIEDAVREMIRPMLKAWLDDNLPSVVESLVRAEIQRVARGGR